MSSTAISRLFCPSSLKRRGHLRPQLYSSHSFRPRVPICMSYDGHGTDVSSVEDRASLSYTSEEPLSASVEPISGKSLSEQLQGQNELVKEDISSQTKRAAKIHDFCFGIPFGGFVLSGGLLGFVFSRSLANLAHGLLYGGALLALSITSMKVWRQGNSSLPFILGQAVLAGSLLLKNVQTYSLTKKVFPTGLYTIISAAMLCFYIYVVLSGGNPPPKKLKKNAAAAVASS